MQSSEQQKSSKGVEGGIEMVPSVAKTLCKSKNITGTRQAKPGKGAQKLSKRAGFGKRMLWAILVTGLLIGSLALRALVVDAGYKLHILEQRLASIQTDYDRLNLSIAQLSSLERIEKEASMALGMIKPEKTEFIMVSSLGRHLNVSDNTDGVASERFSKLLAKVSDQTENIVIGLISPFVARWFYDIPECPHPRVRPK